MVDHEADPGICGRISQLGFGQEVCVPVGYLLRFGDAPSQDDAAEQASELESDKQRLEEELAACRTQIENLTAQVAELRGESTTEDSSG